MTTDFGLRDHFVGVMKGVILGICREAEIIDISHEVQPFSIAQGAFLVAEACRFFPPGTIHIVVVDPGVGTARRPILVQARDQYFVGPDNGVLAMAYTGVPHVARHITAQDYFLQPLSRTFHGRDIFAPLAARLAMGLGPDEVGPEIEDVFRPAFDAPQRLSRRTWCGTVLHTDHFGNLITNFHSREFGDLQLLPFELAIGTEHLDNFALTYAEIQPRSLALMLGSSGYYDVAANQGSAAKILGCGPGTPCELTVG
ncbi:MAG TPA: SAM-dependent chlorinase/fluorinase [Bryobacteraceae bacterium]|nr:SAM-dependent chlorinase/fluorinase [Bryobacteraceae bacterium]